MITITEFVIDGEKRFITWTSSLHVNVHINKVIKYIGNVLICNKLAVCLEICVFVWKKLMFSILLSFLY
jgi:hypothetical protein